MTQALVRRDFFAEVVLAQGDDSILFAAGLLVLRLSATRPPVEGEHAYKFLSKFSLVVAEDPQAMVYALIREWTALSWEIDPARRMNWSVCCMESWLRSGWDFYLVSSHGKIGHGS